MTLAEALASLGATEAEVVETLREAGVRGIRKSVGDCALSKWLAACGFDRASIHPEFPGLGFAVACGEAGRFLSTRLPIHCNWFAINFDAGRYPELEE